MDGCGDLDRGNGLPDIFSAETAALACMAIALENSAFYFGRQYRRIRAKVGFASFRSGIARRAGNS